MAYAKATADTDPVMHVQGLAYSTPQISRTSAYPARMPNALDVVLSLGVIVIAVAIGLMVHKIRGDRLSPRTSMIVSVVCGAGLIVMILTDWPVESMSRFWADHSVLAGLLSSVLLVGLVFLVYEQAEHRHQEQLAAGLSGAGAGGLVDHLVDVETALALVTSPMSPADHVPAWAGWDAPGKPLRWLRESREALDGGARDPRALIPSAPALIDSNMAKLVDQAIRRILAGMRDWTPLVGASDEGTAALLILSQARSDLMDVHEQILRGDADAVENVAEALMDLRRRLRVLTLCFEEWSGAPTIRGDVLTTMDPLPEGSADFGAVGRSLGHRLSQAETALTSA